MNKTIQFLAAVLIAIYAFPAQARHCQDLKILGAGGAAFNDVNISGGVVSSLDLKVAAFSYVIIRFNMKDDDDSISNTRLEMTTAESVGSTPAPYPDQVTNVSPQAVVKNLRIDRDPTDPDSLGKVWTYKIPTIDNTLLFTFTPTGQNAGDELSLSGIGCP